MTFATEESFLMWRRLCIPPLVSVQVTSFNDQTSLQHAKLELGSTFNNIASTSLPLLLPDATTRVETFLPNMSSKVPSHHMSHGCL